MNGWKFFSRGISWQHNIPFGVFHSELGSDYVWNTGELYHSKKINKRFYLHTFSMGNEITFEQALKLLLDSSAQKYFCKLIGVNQIPLQGPPNYKLIQNILTNLKDNRAYCADSAYKFNEEENAIELEFLLANKQIFQNKKESNLFYLPENNL